MGERPAIERGISFVKIVSVVAPLAGLLGTVTGMIITFQQITLFGTGDPKIMAGGISPSSSYNSTRPCCCDTNDISSLFLTVFS